MKNKALTIAIIAGEESGDILGADLIAALKTKISGDISLIGVGGSHLQQLGLKSFFNADDIALMGLSSVLKTLPKLMWHISRLSRFLIQQKPDCIIFVDSPDFSHRVAKKVKAANKDIPIVQYIAPSVWAWRPQRAKAMKAYIDHLLVVLPFEERVIGELGGPPATYVGHRLTHYAPLLAVKNARQKRGDGAPTAPYKLLVLPGSRRSEIEKLMPVFGQSLAFLKAQLGDFEVALPTLARHSATIKDLAQDWPILPKISVSEDDKWQAFKEADVALAASGTVSLELALCHVPMVLTYKTDIFVRLFIQRHIKIWSAALPNIITDQPIIPEFFNEFSRPEMLAHQLGYLLMQPLARQAQLAGFKRLDGLMYKERSSGDIGADEILRLVGRS